MVRYVSDFAATHWYMRQHANVLCVARIAPDKQGESLEDGHGDLDQPLHTEAFFDAMIGALLQGMKRMRGEGVPVQRSADAHKCRQVEDCLRASAGRSYKASLTIITRLPAAIK